MDVRGVGDKMENIKSTSTVRNAAEYIDWIEKSLKNAKDIVEMIERQIPEKLNVDKFYVVLTISRMRLREIALDVGR